jgi:imidazoleglycerol phosphate synthase glutamine amidotransferase subunit HisH
LAEVGCAQVVLPAVGTLYFTLAGIWSLGSGEEVVGTIMAVDLFLGVLLGISQASYNKTVEQGGDMLVHQDGTVAFQLEEAAADPKHLANKKEIRFKVKKSSSK